MKSGESTADSSCTCASEKRTPKLLRKNVIAENVLVWEASFSSGLPSSCLCWPTTVAFMLQRRGGKRICCACGWVCAVGSVATTSRTRLICISTWLCVNPRSECTNTVEDDEKRAVKFGESVPSRRLICWCVWEWALFGRVRVKKGWRSGGGGLKQIGYEGEREG